MRRFLFTWCLSLLGFAAAVLAITLGVDPYGLIGTPRIPGLTADKIAAADRPRMTKPLMVERRDWQTLILGASNTDVGMDPTSDAWPALTRPVFNYGIDGGAPGDQLRFLQHALVTRHPKLILVAIDLGDAMQMPDRGIRRSAAETGTINAEFGYEDRLRVLPDGSPNPDYLHSRIRDTVFATFSLQALTDSVRTLIGQNDPGRTHETEEGANSAGNFARWLRTEGSYTLVMDKDAERTPKTLAWASEGRVTVAPLAEIVRLGHAHGAEVVFFIMPSYVDTLEVLRQTGLTPALERWKMDVAHTLETADPQAPPVPLWDFSGVSPYTTELLPGPGDTEHPLRWFWEPVHFRTALGDVMVRRMLGSQNAPAWGDLVTTVTLPARVAAEADRLRTWAAAHPADVARLAAVIAASARAVCHGTLSDCPRAGLKTTASR